MGGGGQNSRDVQHVTVSNAHATVVGDPVLHEHVLEVVVKLLFLAGCVLASSL